MAVVGTIGVGIRKPIFRTGMKLHAQDYAVSRALLSETMPPADRQICSAQLWDGGLRPAVPVTRMELLVGTVVLVMLPGPGNWNRSVLRLKAALWAAPAKPAWLAIYRL